MSDETAEIGGEPHEAAPAAPAPAPRRSGGGPQEDLTPKARRQRARAVRLPAPRGPRTAAERQAERDAVRAAKAHARRHARAKERVKAREAAPAAAAPGVAGEAVARVPGAAKVRQGIVVSDRASKTITVRIDTSRRHRRYEKIVRSSKTLHAHDEHDEAREGDLVRVIETRPLSRTKRWRLAAVLERAR